MKKMFFLIVLAITVIAFFFVFFSSDINIINKKFLQEFGIEINPSPVSFEEIIIPKNFDSVYTNYNFLQIQSGLDLLDFAGYSAVRYTYEILNFPQNDGKTVYANVICVGSKPVGGDICCPSLDGFMLPLNYLKVN
ncbi:MAG: DUF4830 domain-containing protein [Clostridia bacterium]|nr:DUF4830 domain-containing protein [Clostridia bacterium]